MGTSRRRGPPAKGPDASPDSTNANDIDSFAPQAEEAREALRRLLKVQCAGCYRPYMILGIDLSQYIDGSEVTGFGKCAATAATFEELSTRRLPGGLLLLPRGRTAFAAQPLRLLPAL